MNPSATRFRALHQSGLLILPNVWDAGSARLMQEAGAQAIATTSAGLAWANGWPDGDVLPQAVMLTAVRAIARVISVPLTVDAEGGYSADPAVAAENVLKIAEAGAVGINLEDGAASVDLTCAKIANIRKRVAAAGIDLFINLRTDVYLRKLAPEGSSLRRHCVARLSTAMPARMACSFHWPPVLQTSRRWPLSRCRSI